MVNIRKYGLLCFLLFFANQSLICSSFREDICKFDAYIDSVFKQWKVPGAAVAIVRKNKVEYIKGFGVKERDSKDSVDVHTVFRIASLSKGFASALICILVKKQLINLDDKVVKFLPNFLLKDKESTKNLTIRHILSHTSGLPFYAYDYLLEKNVPYSKIIKKFNNLPLLCAPGECYGYQNVLYAVIGDLIEVVTEESYSTFLYNQILNPLDMKSASTGFERLLNESNVVGSHIKEGDNYVLTDVKPAYYGVIPSAGVNASITDMANWLKAQMGGKQKILSSDILDIMHRPHIKTFREIKKYKESWRNERLKSTYYGLGWRIFNYAGNKLVYHAGALEGTRVVMGFLPDKQVGIVILLNAEVNISSALMAKFLDLCLKLPEKDWCGIEFERKMKKINITRKKSDNIKVVQISDLHIGQRKDLQENIQRLTNTVLKINELKPNVVLVSGDLVEREDIDFVKKVNLYNVVKEILDKLICKYYIVPGNHDDINLLKRVFNLEYLQNIDNFNYLINFNNDFRLIGIDSTFANKHYGILEDKRLKWLSVILEQDLITPTLIFMHHPPVEITDIPASFPLSVQNKISKVIDNPFKEIDGLFKILKKYQNIEHIICGHAHFGFSLVKQGINLTICPSIVSGIETVPSFIKQLDQQILNDAKIKISNYPGFTIYELNKVGEFKRKFLFLE